MYDYDIYSPYFNDFFDVVTLYITIKLLLYMYKRMFFFFVFYRLVKANMTYYGCIRVRQDCMQFKKRSLYQLRTKNL